MTITSYESVRAQLSELNYLYPFSEDSLPLIQALLSDLVSAVTSYKDLELEHEITHEELRLAVEEINRVGVIENPKLLREKNELHVQLVKAKDDYDSQIVSSRKLTLSAEERATKLELMVSQLRHENKELISENALVRTRIDQLLIVPSTSGEIYCPVELAPTDEEADRDHPEFASFEIESIKTENQELEKIISELSDQLSRTRQQYTDLESKFLSVSPLTVSGNWVGLADGNHQNEMIIRDLNERLDFVNDKYRELKVLHDRCGIVSDSPLVDLRESRKELNLVASRYESIKREISVLKSENAKLKSAIAAKKPVNVEPERQPTTIDESELVTTLKEESRQSKRLIESLRRDMKATQNEALLKEKELRALRNAGGGGDKAKDNRRLTGEVALLEEKLRQVTDDRNELIDRLDEIDSSIEAMESEILRIEKENGDLRREKCAKEEAFIGISKQLQEVNGILNSLTDDIHNGEEVERLKFKISQLESDLVKKDDELKKFKSTIDLLRKRPVDTSDNNTASLEALVKTLTMSKDQAMAQVKTLQSELNEKRVKIDSHVKASESVEKYKLEVSDLKSALVKVDHERDELQRVCDDQIEQLEVLRNENGRIKDLSRTITGLQNEADRLRRTMDQKDLQLIRLNQISLDLERKDVQLRSIQAELATAQREIYELTSDNQKLASELGKLHSNHLSQSSVVESLRITEKERNDVLNLYRQVVNENKAISSNLDRNSIEKSRIEELWRERESELAKAAQANHGLVAQCRQAELEIASLRAKIFQQSSCEDLEAQNAALNEQIKDLVALVAAANSQQNHLAVEALPTSLAELERTIEQQYILIGEMDAEQARLIVENSDLREKLLHRNVQ